MQQPHTFNDTTTTEQVVLVPVSDEREALRQAILRSEEFEAWRQYLNRKRLELSQVVAANELEERKRAFVEFIEGEYHATRPVAIVSADGKEIEQIINPS